MLAKVRVSRVAGGGIEVGACSLHGLPAGATAAAAVANSQEISSAPIPILPSRNG